MASLQGLPCRQHHGSIMACLPERCPCAGASLLAASLTSSSLTFHMLWHTWPFQAPPLHPPVLIHQHAAQRLAAGITGQPQLTAAPPARPQHPHPHPSPHLPGSFTLPSIFTTPVASPSPSPHHPRYDSHKSQIIKSGERHQAGGGSFQGPQKPDDEIDLYQYFSSSCFSGYGDGPKVGSCAADCCAA